VKLLFLLLLVGRRAVGWLFFHSSILFEDLLEGFVWLVPALILGIYVSLCFCAAFGNLILGIPVLA